MGSIKKSHKLDFALADNGLTRFPPNVEQISVEHEEFCSWVIARRNGTVLKFPLSRTACSHLAQLLTSNPKSSCSGS